MSIQDYKKTTFYEKITCFNIKQAQKVLKKIKNDTKNVNYGEFELTIEVKFNDRDSNL